MAFALVLSASLAAGASAAVDSSGGFKYVTKDFTTQPGVAKTTKAPCPRRTHVLGGGHYNSGGYGEVIGAHSYPYDDGDRRKTPDDGWAAQLRGLDAAHPASVYAVCAKTFPQYATRREEILPGTVEAVSVSCDPSILTVTAGGSSGSASVREVSGTYPGVTVGKRPRLLAQRGGSDPHRWRQDLANHGGEPRTVTVFAICTSLETRFMVSALGSAVAGEQSYAQVQCPAEAPHVVGGGVATNPEGGLGHKFNLAIAATLPHTFTNPSDGWRTWIDNYYDNLSIPMRATAVCVPPL